MNAIGYLRGKTTDLSELSGLLRNTHDCGLGVVELLRMIGCLREQFFGKYVDFGPDAIVGATT